MKLFEFDTEKTWDYENGFYLTSDIRRVAKTLAHYELYKMITRLPGNVVEFGVFKGASLTRLATFRELLESPYSRKILGFDAFGKFPTQNNSEDQKFSEHHNEIAGHGIAKEELDKVFKFKNFVNYELIKGDINQSLPDYVETHPELKIAFLHIDVDVYQPTKIILECLYERVVRDGVVVFDDYSLINGETRAIDEFLEGKKVTIKKFPFAHTPTYIVKE